MVEIRKDQRTPELCLQAVNGVELQKLDKLIYEKIPSGFAVRKTPHRYNEQIDLTELRCLKAVKLDRAQKSIGTLGGGNHFIEVNKDQEGRLYLVVHSGSRHLGLEVAKHYQEAGYQQLNSNEKPDLEDLITRYKSEGRDKEIEKALKELKSQFITLRREKRINPSGIFKHS